MESQKFYKIVKLWSDVGKKSPYTEGQMTSIYAYGTSAQVTYHMDTKTESATPLFVFGDEQTAYRYFKGYPYHGCLLKGTTDTVEPLSLHGHQMLDISHLNGKDLESFWYDELHLPSHILWGKYPLNYIFDNVYGVYDFTPMAILHCNVEYASISPDRKGILYHVRNNGV